MKIWLECQTVAERQFLEDLVLDGYFGTPLACGESPVNPRSLDINFHDYPFFEEELGRIHFVVKWGTYDDGLYDADCSPKEAAVQRMQGGTRLRMTLDTPPPDLRRGRRLEFRPRTAS